MAQQQWLAYSKSLPWLVYTPCGCERGGYFARDTRTGETVHAPDEGAVHQFAADRSGKGSRFALGDLVHSIASGLGIKRCDACAQRQAKLNGAFQRR